jgi:membrane protein DedA with SNARE-associated domain
VFTAGDLVGHLGAACFLVAGAVIVVSASLRAGWWAVPGGVVLLLASVSFLDSHIFWPRGVLTMLGVAVGMSWVYFAGERGAERRRTR